MLHIKDIEAFAHINEALARDHRTPRPESTDGAGSGAGDHHPRMHPALLVAMAATGRLKPEEGSEDGKSPTGVTGMMARLLNPHGR
jgi:hypothetical protein